MDTDDAILGSLTLVPMGICRFLGITSPKPMTEWVATYGLFIQIIIKIRSFTHLYNF